MPNYRIHYKKIIYGYACPIAADSLHEARELWLDGEWEEEYEEEATDNPPVITEVEVLEERDAE